MATGTVNSFQSLTLAPIMLFLGYIIIIPAKNKKEYAVTAGIPNILIDDKPSTVQAWNSAGGIGILHQPGRSAATVSELIRMGL